jgi:putative transcriptional regulator
MSITHHPAPESLMSCSAGSMPEAFAAVMASHIAMCPSCRKELAVMERIGTVLFEAIAPTAVACEAQVASVRDLGLRDERQSRSDGDVPAPLVIALGTSLDRVPWKWAGRGVWQHQISLSHECSSSLRLIKVAAGLSLPKHSHSGSELTLVLRGSFRDESGQYAAGDVADVSEEIEHAPIADADQGCICLVATEGKLRFKSRIARFIQPLTGF